MSTKEEIVEDLKAIYDGEPWHADNLTVILAGISAAHAVERPVGNAHSVWEIVSHIAGWNDVWSARLEGEDVSEPPAGDFPASGAGDADWAAALRDLERSHFNLIEKIGRVRDEDMPREFAGKGYPLDFFLRGTVRHAVYHSGQIAVLKKSL